MSKPYRVRLDQGDSYIVALPDGTEQCTGYTAEGSNDNRAEREAQAQWIYDQWLVGLRESDRKLYEALLEVGFYDLACRASSGEWNDYFGKHAMTQHHLLSELQVGIHTITREAFAGEGPPSQEFTDYMAKLRKVCERVMAGDFDGTKAEAAEWADSPEGLDIKADIGPEMTKFIFGGGE